MLCAYMLLVKSFTCYWWWIVGVACIGIYLVWTCEITWSMYCCCRVLVHTQLVWWLSSPCWCWIVMYSLFGVFIRGDMMFLLHQGRRPRRWKEIGTTRSRVGLDTLHVLERVVFVYELKVNTWWCICVFDDCCSCNLVLVYSLMRIIMFMFIHASYY